MIHITTEEFDDLLRHSHEMEERVRQLEDQLNARPPGLTTREEMLYNRIIELEKGA